MFIRGLGNVSYSCDSYIKKVCSCETCLQKCGFAQTGQRILDQHRQSEFIQPQTQRSRFPPHTVHRELSYFFE